MKVIVSELVVAPRYAEERVMCASLLTIRTVNAICCLHILLAAGCGRNSDYWSSNGEAETKRRGDVVVAALEEYHAKNGCYPNNLNTLVPGYATDIPMPIIGKRMWQYNVIPADDRYELRVETMSRNMVLSYSLGLKVWIVERR